MQRAPPIPAPDGTAPRPQRLGKPNWPLHRSELRLARELRQVAELVEHSSARHGQLPLADRDAFLRRLGDALWLWADPGGEEEGLAQNAAQGVWAGVGRLRVETALRQSEERQAFLLELSDTLRLRKDPDEIEREAARMLGEHLRVSGVFFGHLLPDGVEVVNEFRRPGASSLLGRYPYLPWSTPLEMVRLGQLFVAADSRTALITAAERERWHQAGIGSLAVVPILRHGVAVASMSIRDDVPRHWTGSEMEFLQENAERVWTVVEHARAEEALRASEAALRASEAALREADSRKNAFLAMLGHELRNPLSVVDGGVRLLQSSRTRPESREVTLPIVAQQVAHMRRLIDDVLDLARLERGKLQVKLIEVDLAAILQTSLEMIDSLVLAKCSQIHYQPPSSPVRLRADPRRLVQVFSNMLTNAVHFSPAGAPIDLKVEVGAAAAVSVRDYGRGIAPESIAEIFEPFVQSELSLEMPEGGLGLGLSVSRELVGLHGGTINAFSAGRNQGSTFVVSLPLLRPE